MTLTNRDLENLAGLRSHEGFQTLVRLLSGQEEVVLNELAETGDPTQFIRLGVFWKALRRLTRTLAQAPESVLEEIERLKRESDWPENPAMLPFRFDENKDIGEII